ncbi:MAG: hypothetical protein Kow0010_09250 [Dehalococcoidia bacterium]
MSMAFLVVEPDRAEADRLAAMLRRIEPRAEVHSAATGEEALRLVAEREQPPSLVLYNHQTPDLHALGFLAGLHSRSGDRTVPVAVLASMLSDQQVINCYRLGAVAVLAVPVQYFELCDTVRGFARPVTSPPRRTSAA